jgi:hypothetical protein
VIRLSRLFVFIGLVALTIACMAGTAYARWADRDSASTAYVQQRRLPDRPGLTLIYSGSDTVPVSGTSFTGARATWVGAAGILGPTYIGLETDGGDLCRAWVLGVSGEEMRSLGAATMPGQYWYPAGSQYRSTDTAVFEWQIPSGTEGGTLFVECTPLVLEPVAETYDGKPVLYATDLSRVCGSWMPRGCLVTNDFRASWVIGRG